MQKQQISTTYMQSGLMYIRTRCRNTIFLCSDGFLKELVLEPPRRDDLQALVVSGADDLDQVVSGKTDL